ncbi:MAG: ATP-binding protein [Miltoncostaeaceae bacterium]
MTAVLWSLVAGLAAVAGLALLRLRGSAAHRDAAEAGLAQAERRCAEAESRRRAVLDALPTVALRVAANGRIVEVSRRAGERFAFLVPGMSVLEAFSEHVLAGSVETALARLEAQHREVRLFADGRRTYRVAVAPYVVGDTREALVVLTDVSEAVAYQELRSQFVANVSHELRTPLTGLRGLLEALDDPAMDDTTRGDFVGRAIAETQRLEALIADILFLSELEATDGLPIAGAADMAAALREVAGDLVELAESQAVDVKVDAPPDAVPCPLTERMAATVARNLLENAVKYAGPGAVARARLWVEGEELHLEVSDDGAGIPERHLPHIFERFYRADPSRSKRLGGTGLGLSIVKHIAERFGGRAEATSRMGFGTTVRVVLPRAGAPGAPGTPPVPGASGPTC